jgi:hypothetical protein
MFVSSKANPCQQGFAQAGVLHTIDSIIGVLLKVEKDNNLQRKKENKIALHKTRKRGRSWDP